MNLLVTKIHCAEVDNRLSNFKTNESCESSLFFGLTFEIMFSFKFFNNNQQKSINFLSTTEN